MNKLLVVLLLVSSSALADWQAVAQSASDDGILYIDLEKGQLVGKTKVRVWRLFSRDTREQGKNWLSVAYYIENDCKDKSDLVLTQIYYSGPMATGKVVKSDSGSQQTIYPPPLSMAESAVEVACNYCHFQKTTAPTDGA